MLLFPIRISADLIGIDPPRFHQNAIVTGFNSISSSSTLLSDIKLMGYSAKRFKSQFDLILLISHHVILDQNEIENLAMIFDRINYVQDIPWPCILEFQEAYFKLNSWTLEMYDNVLWVDPCTLFIRDPSSIFDYSPPASPPQYDRWSLSPLGAKLNLGFLLLQPNMIDAWYMLKVACLWNDFPDLQPSYEPNIAYADGFFQHVFLGNISTLPWWWQYEGNGPLSDILNNISRSTDPRIISVKSSNFLDTPFASLWLSAFQDMLHYLESSQIVRHAHHKDCHGYPNDQILDIYHEFASKSYLDLIFRIFIVLCVSLACLALHLTLQV